MYPLKSWSSYELVLKDSGERKPVDTTSNGFLVQCELLSESGTLTESGTAFFQARFIEKDAIKADEMVRLALLKSRATLAILQQLFGISNVDKSTTETMLRFHGLVEGLTDRSLGTLLTTLSKFRLITYSRNSISVNESLSDKSSLPNSVFISRKTPFSNDVWLSRILADADQYINWFDKHFQPSALEKIWEIADANKIKHVHILSLKMESNSNRKAHKQFENLRTELNNRGITLEWRFIDSPQVRDTHDRWIIGKKEAWNVPDVGTMNSGNHSEISRSSNLDELEPLFEKYWSLGLPAFE